MPAPTVTDGRRVGVTPLQLTRRLPRRVRDDLDVGRLLALGAHGGAGESTVCALLGEHVSAAGHAWPIPVSPATPFAVLVLARTNHTGLTALRDALRDWTAERLPVVITAVVLLADAPGRVPRRLGELLEAITLTSPVTPLQIDWQPAWRLRQPLGSDPPAAQLLRAARPHLPTNERTTRC